MAYFKKCLKGALAGVAQWIENPHCQPVNQKVTGSIPSQLGEHERQPHIDVSLPPPLSKNK